MLFLQEPDSESVEVTCDDGMDREGDFPEFIAQKSDDKMASFLCHTCSLTCVQKLGGNLGAPYAVCRCKYII